MNKRILFVIGVGASLMLAGCQHRSAANPVVDRLDLAREKESQAAQLQHDALCLRVAAGEVTAMAEMKLRQTICNLY